MGIINSKLLVIIITFNGMQWIEKCISSVLNSSYPSDIFIVDNGSTDGTIEFLDKLSNKIILIKSKYNLGFGKANNLGLKYALENSYDYVYLLNQDAWVLDKTFEILINCLKKNSDIGIISPLQVDSSLSKLDSNFSNCCPNEMLSDSLFKDLKDVYYCNFVMAAHWMITAKCLRKIGGFSPIFPHYGEDNNYSQRVLMKGFKIAIESKVLGVHDRDNRVVSRDKLLYLRYVKTLIIFANPNQKFKLIRILFIYVYNLLTNFSWNFFNLFLKFIIRIPQNYIYYKQSFKLKPFL